jgi:hypothetical protein
MSLKLMCLEKSGRSCCSESVAGISASDGALTSRAAGQETADEKQSSAGFGENLGWSRICDPQVSHLLVGRIRKLAQSAMFRSEGRSAC